MDPLRGEYGFLTQFSGITEGEARARVRNMSEHFGILEFQFYDAFEGYSQPPADNLEFWTCACLQKAVQRSILKAYVEEIRKVGGRSWFYVQAMATNPNDIAAQVAGGQQGALGQHLVDGIPLLDVVLPTPRWAHAIAPQWAIFAASLGFSGIHWDTLGNMYAAGEADGYDLSGFLRAARPVLDKIGLAQTCNFVDGFSWDASLHTGPGVGWAAHTLAFPYWEVWTLPAQEDRFFEEVAPHGGGVFVCYPGKTATHEGEAQNNGEAGVWPLDLMIKRWRRTRCRGSAYLAVGDGYRHIQSEYFPDTAEVSEVDRDKIRRTVLPDCPQRTPAPMPELVATTTASADQRPGYAAAARPPAAQESDSLPWLLALFTGMVASCILGSHSSQIVERLSALLSHFRSRAHRPLSTGAHGVAMLSKHES